jgi:hypothetical protein
VHLSCVSPVHLSCVSLLCVQASPRFSHSWTTRSSRSCSSSGSRRHRVSRLRSARSICSLLTPSASRCTRRVFNSATSCGSHRVPQKVAQETVEHRQSLLG